LGDLLEKLKGSYAGEVILEATEGKKINVKDLWAQIYIQTNRIGEKLTREYRIKDPKKELLGISEENASSVGKRPEKQVESPRRRGSAKRADKDKPTVKIIGSGNSRHIEVTYKGKTYTGTNPVPPGITFDLLKTEIKGNKIVVSYSGRQLRFSEEFTIEK